MPVLGEVQFDLADVVGGKSETTINTSLDSLTDGNQVVAVHESPARAFDDPAACGPIPRAAG